MNLVELRQIIKEEFTDVFEDVIRKIGTETEVQTREVPFESVSGFIPFTDGGLESAGYIHIHEASSKLKGFNSKADSDMDKKFEMYCVEIEECEANGYESCCESLVRTEIGCFIYSSENHRKEFPNGSIYIYLSINCEEPYYREKYSQPLFELDIELTDYTDVIGKMNKFIFDMLKTIIKEK